MTEKEFLLPFTSLRFCRNEDGTIDCWDTDIPLVNEEDDGDYTGCQPIESWESLEMLVRKEKRRIAEERSSLLSEWASLEDEYDGIDNIYEALREIPDA